MRRTLMIVLSSSFLCTTAAVAEQNAGWKELIKTEYVRSVDSEYRYETFQRCRAEGSDRVVQIRSSATAPEGAVSRDFFLWIAAGLDASFTNGLKRSVGEGKVRCQTVPGLEGSPDAEFQIQMTEEGVQIDVLLKGEKTQSQKQAWAEIL